MPGLLRAILAAKVRSFAVLKWFQVKTRQRLSGERENVPAFQLILVELSSVGFPLILSASRSAFDGDRDSFVI